MTNTLGEKGIWILVEPSEGQGCRLVVSDNGVRNIYPKVLEIEEALSNALVAQELIGLPDERVCIMREVIEKNADRSIAAWKVHKLLQLQR